MDKTKVPPSTGKNIKPWFWILVIGGIIAGSVQFTCWLYRDAETIERRQCLHFWTATLWGYYNGVRLPPATIYDKTGIPLYSWRFQEWILLYATESQEPLNHSWESPSNARFRMLRTKHFLCRKDGTSAVAVVTGHGTAFDGRDGIKYSDVPPQCILLIEYWGNDVHWMQPGDFPIELLSRESATAAGLAPDQGRRDGFFVSFFDGQVWLLKLSTPLELIRKCCLVKSASTESRQELSAYRIMLK
jgi:hypothetical protein